MEDTAGSFVPPRSRKAIVAAKTLALFIPLACIICLLLWRLYSVERSAQLNAVVSDEKARLELFRDSLEAELEQALQDLLFLESLQAPALFLQAPSAARRQRLEDTFLSLAKSRGDYDQIRLLDASGKEVVRVNYNSGAPAPVAQKALQDKGDRYYFTDAMALPPGAVFISPLDLNIEHGEVERPFKPMLRLAVPVYGPLGKKDGVLLLNVLAENLLARLSAPFSEANGRLMLMNRNGYWLKGLAPEDEWGFMFPESQGDSRFQNRFPEVWRYAVERPQTQQLSDQGLFCTRKILPLEDWQRSSTGTSAPEGQSDDALDASQFFWVLASYLPRERLTALLPSPARYLILGGVLLWLFAVGSFLLALFHERLSSAFSRLKTNYARLESTERRLREREAFYRSLFENNLAMLMLVAPENGTIVQANNAVADFYGYELERLMGSSITELDERSSAEVLEELQNAAARNSVRRFATHVLHTAERREMELYIGPVRHDDRTLLFCILHDVTEQRQAERTLRDREELLRTISDAAQDAIIMIGPDDAPLFWNPAAAKMFGYSFEELEGKSLHALLTPPDEREKAIQAVQRFAQTGTGLIVGTLAEMDALKKDGSIFPVEISLSALALPHGWGAVASVRDITERKQFEEKLHVLATTDPLTGLSNRREFLEEAERELSRARRHEQGLALLMLDADHFKLVNDTYGHDAGDNVLKNIAAICLDTMRSEDACARFGGEEFAVLVTETDHSGAVRAAERLRQGIEKSSLRYNNENISITASIGVALAFEHGDTIPDLLRQADSALYRAKARGRNCVEMA